jgi:hypothetical protein
MKVTALLLGLLLALGLGLGAWMLASQRPVPAPARQETPVAQFDPSAGVDERLGALEQALAEERDARQLLEEQVQVLQAEVSALTGEREAGPASDPQGIERTEDVRARFETLRDRRESPEGRKDLLMEAGFAPDRAEWIVQREAELQMAAMQARFEARRSGEPLDPFDPAVNPERALREEIGDGEYEQYLAANGRPTSVAVNMVLDASPGQAAGLQVGDEILRYDGERVFNSFDLTSATMQGEPGESVVVDILREGSPMQVVMPRGPIGITTGGRFRPR